MDNGAITASDLVVSIARRLIQCQSVTGPGAEMEVASVVEDLLSAEPNVAVTRVTARPDRPNVVATLQGRRPGPSLLLTGHLDVVPVTPSGWTYPPFEGVVVDGELWGRGAADMKGGVAGLMTAFIRAARSGGPDFGELVLAATADEEGGGEWGLPWLVAQGHLDVDYALVAEPAGIRTDYDCVPICTRGSAYASVKVTAEGGHTSLGRSLGRHAVATACELQQAIEAGFRPSPSKHWAFPDGPTVTAGELFRGGQRLGELPREAEFTVNCRLLPGAVEDHFLSALRGFVEPLVPPGSDVTVSFVDDILAWGPGMDLSRDDPFATLGLRAVRDAGFPAADFGGFPGFSEGTFLAAAGVPTLPGLGPGALIRAHLPDERVNLRALEASVSIYESVIQSVLIGPELATGQPVEGGTI